MGLDELVRCIELIQGRIRTYEAMLRERETRTRMALIDPLLKALGWDVDDPGMVTPEHKVSSGWADYALLRPDGTPAATIEAKKFGTQLKDYRDQMLKYAITDGIKYAGLTDGNNWELYDIFQPVKLEEKRILEVSIAGDPIHESALKLLLLWRGNLKSGEPVPANPPIIATPPVKPVPPVAPSGSNWVPLPEYDPPTGTPSPTAIWFWDQEQHTVESWIQIFIRVVEKLYRDGCFTVQDLPIGWTKTTSCVHTEPVHPDGKPFVSHKKIAGTPLVVSSHVSAGGVRSHSKKILRLFKKNPADVYLQKAK